MNKRSKACSIILKVKKIIWERDNYCCVICGDSNSSPNAHLKSRAHGGLGIEENVATLCMKCHHDMDNGLKRKEYLDTLENYMRSIYENWDDIEREYKKWSN